MAKVDRYAIKTVKTGTGTLRVELRAGRLGTGRMTDFRECVDSEFGFNAAVLDMVTAAYYDAGILPSTVFNLGCHAVTPDTSAALSAAEKESR